MNTLYFLIFYLFLNCSHYSTLCLKAVNKNRVFEVDYVNNQFLKDCKPFRYVSGSFHYFRTPKAYWTDRLKKIRAAGLNAITTYIEWSLHEPSPGVYDFTGEKDIAYFLRLAQKENLLVILRPGPYICTERDFGGYPSWLLSMDVNMKLRTTDKSHIKHVHCWLKTLMPILQPYLYGNGGPVIMIQVENEYGSYFACDKNYTTWLRDIFHSYIGKNAVLFTTDGYSKKCLTCGPIANVLATVDFGPGTNVKKGFQALRNYQPHGPLVNSEYYEGHLTHWSENIVSANVTKIVGTLKNLLNANASLNFYMFAGGTNFGFTSGANLSPQYLPVITSYHYDAPISEAGDLTKKYYAIKDVLKTYLPVPNIHIPPIMRKGRYGKVILKPKVSLFNAPYETHRVKSVYPLTFESLNQSYGFMLYEKVLEGKYSDPAILSIPRLHDRAIVYLNKRAVCILSRTQNVTSMPLMVRTGQTLHLLVENQGRVNYGDFKDPKGILSNVSLSRVVLMNWTITGYPLNNITLIEDLPSFENKTNIIPPAFYTGKFRIPESEPEPLDTFINLNGWGKGVVFINKFNLGRYWPTTGPQITLYVPGCYLQPYPNENIVTILELEYAQSDYTVNFIPAPIFKSVTSPT